MKAKWGAGGREIVLKQLAQSKDSTNKNKVET